MKLKCLILIAIPFVLLGAHFSTVILAYEKKAVTAVCGVLGCCTNCSGSGTVASDPGAYAYGIDVSHWQGDEIRKTNQLSDSLSFIICKATEGITYVDPEFDSNKVFLDSSKYYSGYYHFYRCEDSPIAQAQFYVNQVKTFGDKVLPPIVDIENQSKGSACTAADMDSLLVFIQEVEKLTNYVPIIYTNSSFGKTNLTDSAFADYPLWVADYSDSTPELFGGWTTWTFWQMSDHYMLGNTKNDLDVFNGNESELKKFISKSKKS
ncbi:MAG: hypothetical protein MI810_07325 [Flavobacteriales bacterium]|nr:hypothetical protein [Flavobacteriales bacterium]